MPHLFISYAKKDTRKLALALDDALNALEGVTSWVDRSLKAGHAWELQIQAQIDKCDTMIVLYSPDINRHKQGEPESYVLNEIAYTKYTVKKPIIPVMAQQTDSPMSLTMTHYIDYTIEGLTLDDLIDALCAELDIANTLKQSPALQSTQTVSKPIMTNHVSSVERALEKARNFKGTSNSDWTPIIMPLGDIISDTPIPDMEMCLVPVGKFMMGADGDFAEFDYEEPAHLKVIEKPYWISRYPITNNQYRQAVEARAVEQPKNVEYYNNSKLDDTPVVYVNWFMSRQFVNWAKCSLSSELHWEYASRGVESWIYPWGNSWENGKNVVWFDNREGKFPHSVTLYPNGNSWVGAMHLIGNVWEWQSSVYQRYPYIANDGRERDFEPSISAQRVLRGSSWGSGRNSAHAVRRYSAFPNDAEKRIGFRCVYIG